MIPLKDNIPSSTFPLVNYLVIALCTLAFLAQLADQGDGRENLIERYGMVPARVLAPDRPIVVEQPVGVRSLFGTRVVLERRLLEGPPFTPWLTLLTCIFLHGGWLHFLGNMWFLWIFGDNVEDRFGHLGYLLFYLAAGVGASVFHLATNAASGVPTIGASGAIAGVMGAYFLLYPRARVLTLVPLFVFMEMMVLPAALFLGVWFALQLLQGTAALGSASSGGVAWWAHIGGFVFGMAAAWLLRISGSLRRQPVPLMLQPRHLGRRRGPL